MEIANLVKPRRGRPCKTGATIVPSKRSSAPTKVKRVTSPHSSSRGRDLDPIGTTGPITFPTIPMARVHVGYDDKQKPVFIISPASASDAFVGTFEEFCKIREEKSFPISQYYVVTIKAISERIVSQFEKEPIEFVCYGDKNLIAYNKTRDVFVRRYIKGHGSSQFTIRYNGVQKSVAEWFGSMSSQSPPPTAVTETKADEESPLFHVARGRPSSTTTQVAPKEFPQYETTTAIKLNMIGGGFSSQQKANANNDDEQQQQQIRVVERKRRQAADERMSSDNPNPNPSPSSPTSHNIKDSGFETRGEGVCELSAPIR